MSSDNLDLAKLRRIAEDRLGGRFRNDGMADPETVLALLNRIKELEARLAAQREEFDGTTDDQQATIDGLQARLARVTDDSMSMTLHRMLMSKHYIHDGQEASFAVTDILAVIRAVAADEQEAVE